ncbi:MAG TPA: glycosyltransferase [Chitinophaga sp.]|uniref:glycosyltransferase family 2 protein n=1 Tax=Chitinophaga sp. TaxID=1869181 RepID=UPI002DB81AE6|nr:glycosyltransferase [Chitinophaga sp.]HEU4551936.1 glycosyltransferase [Chitinophaga sp.]
MEKKISVVIPTYRRPQLLMQCITALARQHFERDDFEVIVVSDGPDSITKKQVVSWKHTGLLDIRYIPLPAKKGPAAARNAGWRAAGGVIIAFTDDDCQPDENWLRNIWEQYCSQPYIAFTGRVIVPAPEKPTDHEWNTAQLEKADFITANCACTRLALEKTGGFDERFELAWREDSDLEFKLLLNNIPIVHLNNAIVVHPVRPADWGISLREQRKSMFNALLYKKYPELYRRKIRQSPPWNYYIMIVSLVAALAGLLAHATWLTVIALPVWLIFLGAFIKKRLTYTSRAWPHVLEMVVTSIFIPFLSVYWNLYGAFRYRVLFI